MNPEVGQFGQWILIYYIGVGLHAALVTVMDESLELAMGLHSANNVYGALIVTFPSSALSTPALFTMQEYDAVGMTIAWLIMAIVFFFVVSKIYNWQDYGKLTRSIDTTPDIIADEAAL